MDFKDIIKELRIQKGLDRETAAKLIEVAKQTLGHYETGRSEPPFKVLKKMAEVYGVSIGELFGETKPTTVEVEKNQDILAGVLEILDNKGALNNAKTFDDLDFASKQIITSVVNKVISDLKK